MFREIPNIYPHLCTDSLVTISTEEGFLPGEKSKVLAAQNACGSEINQKVSKKSKKNMF